MIDKFQEEERADAAYELKRVLDYNELDYTENDGRISLIFSDKGCKWETQCAWDGSTIMIYGIYPFEIRDRAAALEFCGKVNRRVIIGAMIMDQNKLMYRCGTELFDAYSAYETIGRLLEYNAGIMTGFWEEACEV